MTTKFYLQLVFFIVLFFGAIQPNYAIELGGVGVEKEVGKSAEGVGAVRAWGVISDGPPELRRNIEALEIFDDHVNYLGSSYSGLKLDFDSAIDKIKWLDDRGREVRSAARSIPGTAAGQGKVINGNWLKGTEGNAGQFPDDIATILGGQNFSSFDSFRNAFWKAIAEHPIYGSQFSSQNLGRMNQGLAPYAKETQQLGGQKSYILHHNQPIYQGGAVYNVDNLTIVTPRYHKEILSPSYHYGN